MDLSARTGTMAITGGDDPEVLEKLWKRRRSLFEHLARTAHEFWIADQEGVSIGFARSIVRGDLLELTDGNLSVHVQKLEEAGYVAVDKTFEGRRPKTWIWATSEGHDAFAAHIDALEAIIRR